MSPARGLLITATDTGVGKTLVGCALASALAAHVRVGVLKPAETGCSTVAGELVPEDAIRLRAAAHAEASFDLVCPYRFAEPLAPWIAAERSGRPIDPARIRDCFRQIATVAEVVFVESAGGLLVPLTRAYCYADLAAELELPLLVVVGSRLGAINQTLLTLECARRRKLEIAGYVLNQLTPESDLAQETNVQAIAELVDSPCVGRISHLSLSGDARRDADALRRIGKPLAERLFPSLIKS